MGLGISGSVVPGRQVKVGDSMLYRDDASEDWKSGKVTDTDPLQVNGDYCKFVMPVRRRQSLILTHPFAAEPIRRDSGGPVAMPGCLALFCL